MKKWYSPKIEVLNIKATKAGLPAEDGDGEVWELSNGQGTLPAGPSDIIS